MNITPPWRRSLAWPTSGWSRLVAERQAAGRRISRDDVLRDAAMQRIMASIDESVRAIFPIIVPDAAMKFLRAFDRSGALGYSRRVHGQGVDSGVKRISETGQGAY